eukprot:1188563-Rhodomonas_salina.1
MVLLAALVPPPTPYPTQQPGCGQGTSGYPLKGKRLKVSIQVETAWEFVLDCTHCADPTGIRNKLAMQMLPDSDDQSDLSPHPCPASHLSDRTEIVELQEHVKLLMLMQLDINCLFTHIEAAARLGGGSPAFTLRVWQKAVQASVAHFLDSLNELKGLPPVTDAYLS